MLGKWIDKKKLKKYNFFKEKKLDKKLLTDLFKIPNPSGQEKEVRDFIADYLDKMGIEYNIDKMGNLYRLNDKSLPILNAHMDSVQDFEDTEILNFVTIINGVLRGYGNIAGDDKCGIYIILDILQRRDINFLFTISEEIGCVGAKGFIRNNSIEDFPYALTLDRWGSGDIICHSNEYGTKEFEEALFTVGAKYGYTPEKGLYSDADFISEQLSCANISVGYYCHHTKKEYVVLSELQNSINFVESVIDKVKSNFDAPDKKASYYNLYDLNGYEEYMIEDDYFESYDELTQKCLVTKKTGGRLYFMPSLNGYVSPKGARSIFEDLEQSGVLFEDDEYQDFNENNEEIDEILREINN